MTLQYSDYAAVSVGSVSRVQSECFYLFGSSYHFSVTFISVLFSCAVLNFTVNVLTPPPYNNASQGAVGTLNK